MKIDGLATAAQALRYWERRQEVVANNLANVNTAGFKAERIFARLVEDAVPAAEGMTDTRAGTMRETGNALDLASENQGFFVVGTANGERLSRGGSFRLDTAGRLVDTAGNTLLAEDGPVILPQGAAVAIDRTGVVKVDGRIVARLRMEGVPPGTRLQHDAGTLFMADASRRPLGDDARAVKQGYLEESNVSSVGEMVDMIEIQRTYASVQQVIRALDDVRGTIANSLSKMS